MPQPHLGCRRRRRRRAFGTLDASSPHRPSSWPRSPASVQIAELIARWYAIDANRRFVEAAPPASTRCPAAATAGAAAVLAGKAVVVTARSTAKPRGCRGDHRSRGTSPGSVSKKTCRRRRCRPLARPRSPRPSRSGCRSRPAGLRTLATGEPPGSDAGLPSRACERLSGGRHGPAWSMERHVRLDRNASGDLALSGPSTIGCESRSQGFRPTLDPISGPGGNEPVVRPKSCPASHHLHARSVAGIVALI